MEFENLAFSNLCEQMKNITGILKPIKMAGINVPAFIKNSSFYDVSSFIARKSSLLPVEREEAGKVEGSLSFSFILPYFNIEILLYHSGKF